MRPASLADAALPSAITEAAQTGALTGLCRLADMKNRLGMSLAQTDQDAHIMHLMAEAQATIEASTGMKLSPASGATAEYVLGYEGCRSLCIPESDFVAVVSVVEYDDAGDETTLAASGYDVRRADGRAYIVRAGDEGFPMSRDGGLSAVVSYTRGIEEDSDNADLARSAMGHLVVGLYRGDGTHIEAKMRANGDYMRCIRLLRNQTPVI